MLASSMEESGRYLKLRISIFLIFRILYTYFCFTISVLGALPDKFIDDLVLPNKEPVGMI